MRIGRELGKLKPCVKNLRDGMIEAGGEEGQVSGTLSPCLC